MTNHTPIPPTALAAIRHPGAWTIDYPENTEIHDRFDAPEFYENGPVVTVQHTTTNAQRTILIYREGEARLCANDGDLIESSSEFRDSFPDGNLPNDADDRYEWALNGWFDLYDADTGDHLDCVSFSLKEAVTEAHGLLEEAAIEELTKTAHE